MSLYDRIPSRRREGVQGKVSEYYHKPSNTWYSISEVLSGEMDALPTCTVTRSTLVNRIHCSNAGKTRYTLDECIGAPLKRQGRSLKPKPKPKLKPIPILSPSYLSLISFDEVHKLM